MVRRKIICRLRGKISKRGSFLDFGEIETKNGQQEIYSKPPKDINVKIIPEMVTVQDPRVDSQRNR